MTTAIDVRQRLVAALAAAGGNDPERRAHAEAELASVELLPGFASALVDAISGDVTSEDEEVSRLLGAVYLKNFVIKCWRTRGTFSARSSGNSIGLKNIIISEEEKLNVRTRLWNCVLDRNPQVAVQVSVTIAKIARVDYPRTWPDLFSSVAEHLRATDNFVSFRVLQALHYILKYQELSTKRLPHDQRAFCDVARQLFRTIFNSWQKDVEGLFTFFSNSQSMDEQGVSILYGRWALALKALRRLITLGLPIRSITESDRRMVLDFIQSSSKVVNVALLQMWSPVDNSGSKISYYLGRIGYLLLKAYNSILESHLSLCLDIEVLPQSAQMMLQVVGSAFTKGLISIEKGKASLYAMLAVQNLIRHNSSGQVEDAKQQRVLSEIFNDSTLLTLVKLIVEKKSSYLLLTEEDISDWQSDPESWCHDQDSFSPEDRPRQCAESLLVLLLGQYRDKLASQALEIIGIASEGATTIIQKEAAYNALGQVAYDLYDYVNFDELYHRVLRQELESTDYQWSIVIRRILILISKWVSKINAATRRDCYAILLNVLKSEPSGCRLTAVQSLRALIEDWGFVEIDIEPVLQPLLMELLRFGKDAYEIDSQLQTFGLVALMIDTLGDKINPHLGTIVDTVPHLWEASVGHGILRLRAIELLQRIVSRLGRQSTEIYHILVPILNYSVDLSSPESLTILEDGLILWYETIRNAPKMIPEFVQLITRIYDIISRSFENFQEIMALIEVYAFMGVEEIVSSSYLKAFCSVFDAIIGNVREEGIVKVLPRLDVFILALSIINVDAIGELSGTLAKILEMHLDPQTSPIVAAHCVVVLARTVIHSPDSLLSIISSAAQIINEDPAIFSSRLIELWIERADNVASSFEQKTILLGLCAFFQRAMTAMGAKICHAENLQMLLAFGTVVIAVEKDPNSDIEIRASCRLCEDEATDMETAKRQQLMSKDIVSQIGSKTIVDRVLEISSTVLGSAAFSQLLGEVDPSILKRFRES